jgi:hypothetical protein
LDVINGARRRWRDALSLGQLPLFPWVTSNLSPRGALFRYHPAKTNLSFGRPVAERPSALPSMDYRGIDFTVVQSLSPKGWKWSVSLGHKDAGGTQYDRESAVRRAKLYIDELIKKREQSEQ